MKKLSLSTNQISLIGILFIIGLTAIAYSNLSTHRFLNWDDIDYIVKNDHLKSFNLQNIIWMFTEFGMANWHPLTWLSFTFNYTFWGHDAIAYKTTNIILHIANSILVYLLTYKVLTLIRNNYHAGSNSYFSFLTDKELLVASLFTAILFGIHPTHVESVTWISERKDVLYSLFFLLTILFYIKHREITNDRNFLLASIVMFLFSLMSKPMAVTVPVLLMLIDIYPLNFLKNQPSLRHAFLILFANKTSYIALALIVSIITLLTQRSGIQGTEGLAILPRIINACMSLLLYVYNYVWPESLSPFYSFHPWVTDPNIFSFVPVVVVILISVWFFYLAARKNIFFPIIGWLYFIISLLPVIGLVKVGAQAAADRYTYMPLLSFFIVSGALAALVYSYTLRSKLLVLFTASSAALLIGVLTFLTYQQNDYWKNDESLWVKAIDYSPGTASIPYSNLGTVHFRRGESRLAVELFSKALAIQPNDATSMERLGKAYELMREEKLTMHTYKELISRNPDNPIGYIRLGDFYYRKRMINQAKYLYNKAFILEPSAAATLQRSALVDYFDKNYSSAEQKLAYMLQMRPNDIGGLQLLAKVKLDSQQYDAAQDIAQNILLVKPKDSFALEILQKRNVSRNSEFKKANENE